MIGIDGIGDGVFGRWAAKKAQEECANLYLISYLRSAPSTPTINPCRQYSSSLLLSSLEVSDTKVSPPQNRCTFLHSSTNHRYQPSIPTSIAVRTLARDGIEGVLELLPHLLPPVRLINTNHQYQPSIPTNHQYRSIPTINTNHQYLKPCTLRPTPYAE